MNIMRTMTAMNMMTKLMLLKKEEVVEFGSDEQLLARIV
jgi:ABC-type multidrug transport system fused ATPase/permease subunit